MSPRERYLVSFDCGFMADYRRLFISGIPVGATEDEISKRFQVFGEVSSIEKVVRSQEGFPIRCFAYLDISLSDANYHKCLSLYSKAKWKGNQLLIQPAKESFLKRLEAERREKALDDASLNKPNISPNYSTELQVKSKDGRRLMKVNVLKNSKKIKRFSSQSVMENYGNVSDLTWDLTPTTHHKSPVSNSLPVKKKDKTVKRKESNRLRLEALERSKDHHHPLIAEASKAASHVVFEPEDNDEVVSDSPGQPKEKILLPLFGSDSEHDSEDGMEVTKPKFEGKKGAKLFKLQQKIGWDKRFEVDERFLNTSDSSSDESTPAEQDDEAGSSHDEDLRKEQQRNRDLIEEMFGNTASAMVPQSQTVTKVLRYDPSAMGSELLEKQPPPVKKTVKKVEDVKAPSPPTEQLQETDKPEVSKECFYSVSDSLKDVLKTAEGGHTFNFTTSTPKDTNSSTTMVTGSKNTPNWLLNLQDDNSDSSGSDETASTIPHSEGQKRTLFFFHASSSELRNRLDYPDTKFVRTCSLEELEAKWPQTRARLKEQYKRRHRDALRWLRQRKQIK